MKLKNSLLLLAVIILTGFSSRSSGAPKQAASAHKTQIDRQGDLQFTNTTAVVNNTNPAAKKEDATTVVRKKKEWTSLVLTNQMLRSKKIYVAKKEKGNVVITRVANKITTQNLDTVLILATKNKNAPAVISSSGLNSNFIPGMAYIDVQNYV